MSSLVLLLILGCSGSGEASAARDNAPAPPAEAPRAPFPEPPPPSGAPPLTLAAGRPSPIQIPIENGTVTVALESPPRFMVNEPAFARLVLTVNAESPSFGTATFFSQPSDEAGRPPGFVVAFRSADGRVLGERPGSPGNGGSGQTSDPIELPLWAYAALTPGRYTLHVEANVRVSGTDHPIAIETPIEVLPFDPAAVGRVIDDLGTRALSEDYETSEAARRLLQEVTDPRVIPWWIRLAESGSSSRRSAGIYELTKWNDPRARDALIRATRLRPEDLPRDEFTTEELRTDTAQRLRQTAVTALCERNDPVARAAVSCPP
jgi:hypothetical protein